MFVPFLFACLVTLLLFYAVLGGLLHALHFALHSGALCCAKIFITLLHIFSYIAYFAYLHVAFCNYSTACCILQLFYCVLHFAIIPLLYFACLALSCAALTPLCLLCYALYKLYMHILYLYIYFCTYSILCNVLYVAF